MLLLIDNFDSFTYNIVQAFQSLTVDVKVVRNNQSIPKIDIKYLVIGPGPGTPSGAGISKLLIKEYSGKIPILGICLGHQAIGEVFGAKTVCAHAPMHGKLSTLSHTGQGIFKNIPQQVQVTRYHSLVLDPKTFPDQLERTAHTEDGEIMGIQHKEHPTFGVQFHPESILSDHGLEILKRFLSH